MQITGVFVGKLVFGEPQRQENKMFCPLPPFKNKALQQPLVKAAVNRELLLGVFTTSPVRVKCTILSF